jgi:hypothetical protein
MEDQRLHFVWTLSFDLSLICCSITSLRSRQKVNGGPKPPLHDNAVATEEKAKLRHSKNKKKQFVLIQWSLEHVKPSK